MSLGMGDTDGTPKLWCNDGWWSAADACSVCRAGSYCSLNETTQCPDISAGFSSAQGAGDVEDCYNIYTCMQGYYCPSGTKEDETKCPPNSDSRRGSRNRLDCFCIKGYYEPAAYEGEGICCQVSDCAHACVGL